MEPCSLLCSYTVHVPGVNNSLVLSEGVPSMFSSHNYVIVLNNLTSVKEVIITLY